MKTSVSLGPGASLDPVSCSANGDNHLSHCPGPLACPLHQRGLGVYGGGAHSRVESEEVKTLTVLGEPRTFPAQGPRHPGLRGSTECGKGEGSERMSLRSLIS